jgi:enediyne biosynthesis protein E4
MTRRQFGALLASTPLSFESAGLMRGQGVSTRNLPPRPHGKPSGIPFLAQFTDIAAQAGLHSPVICGDSNKPAVNIIETVGCGVAFFDYDNDGWLDIFVLSGTRLDGPPPGAGNRLYKNNRDGTFTDVTKRAGLERVGWASAVTVGDYNNDGNEDMFLTYFGQNVLYRNNGDGTFTDVTRQAGLHRDGTFWSTACTFIDYDRDGRLDLFVGHYAHLDIKATPAPGFNSDCLQGDVPVFCGPHYFQPVSPLLYRNNGDGTFTDVSARSGIGASMGTRAMTAVAADFDNDGWTDIYVSCDGASSLLFLNNRDGTFREEGLERGVALNEDGVAQAGMGLGIGDYDLDGSLDIFKTHYSGDTNSLYKNDGKAYFDDMTSMAGLIVETRYIGWGAGMVDLDNDGLPDLFGVTGGTYPGLEKQLPKIPWKTPRFLFRNLGMGKFEELIDEAGPGFSARHCSRGSSFGDFDNDGDIDIVVVNLNEPPSLLRNDLRQGADGRRNWLKVRLIGTTSNRSAIGSRVTAHYGGKMQARAVLAQSSFYSVDDRRLHFGLGSAGQADLTVRWTNGLVENFAAVEANRLLTISEGGGIVRSEKWR